jgi:hypothetical protein
MIKFKIFQVGLRAILVSTAVIDVRNIPDSLFILTYVQPMAVLKFIVAGFPP